MQGRVIALKTFYSWYTKEEINNRYDSWELKSISGLLAINFET